MARNKKGPCSAGSERGAARTTGKRHGTQKARAIQEGKRRPSSTRVPRKSSPDSDEGLRRLLEFATPRKTDAIRLSVNNSPAEHPTRGWRPRDYPGWDVLARNRRWYLHGQSAYAPVEWRNGYRAKANFIGGQVFALDVDDGDPRYQDALGQLRGMDGLAYTTRSHQRAKTGITCDRYRLWLSLDRRVDDPASWDVLQRSVCALVPTADVTSSRSYMFYWGGTSDGQVDVLAGVLALCVDSLLSYGLEMGLHRVEDRELDDVLTFDFDGGKVNEDVIWAVERWFADKELEDEWAAHHTFQKIFAAMVYAAGLCRPPKTILASLLSWDRCAQWLARHPSQARTFRDQVCRAFAVRFGSMRTRRSIKPVIPVEVIGPQAVSIVEAAGADLTWMWRRLANEGF